LANYEVVKILLDAGADPNICNADGTSPLATAFCVAFADKAEVSTVSVAQEGLGQSQSPAASVTRRRQAEKIIEELFRRGARAEAGSGQSYLKLLKTALYGNSTSILASLLAPRADADDAPLVAMEALVSDSSELLNYLLNMRKRKNTQLDRLKQLLTLFIDGRQSGGGADHEDPGVGANLTIACRLDVNMTRAGRTPVHDLVLASVFAVANASKAVGALPHASLAFERELIDFLVAKGAQINQPDQNTGFTPLVSAGTRWLLVSSSYYPALLTTHATAHSSVGPQPAEGKHRLLLSGPGLESDRPPALPRGGALAHHSRQGSFPRHAYA
jgi:hypothetical protein